MKPLLALLLLGVTACAASADPDLLPDARPTADARPAPDAALAGIPPDAAPDAALPDGGSAGGHLLLSEVNVVPDLAAFIEIVNPTSQVVPLDNYLLSDDEDYALYAGWAGAGPEPSISLVDFIVRFPEGASIESGEVITIALSANGFFEAFGSAATYTFNNPAETGATQMLLVAGWLPILSPAGENLVLFTWDGSSDLIGDVDMINVGLPGETEAIGDKTLIAVDGPDEDLLPSQYAADAHTMPMQLAAPGEGTSTKRIAGELGYEISGSGNGITGDDETSEDISLTWDAPPYSAPTPGTVPAALLP